MDRSKVWMFFVKAYKTSLGVELEEKMKINAPKRDIEVLLFFILSLVANAWASASVSGPI